MCGSCNNWQQCPTKRKPKSFRRPVHGLCALSDGVPFDFVPFWKGRGLSGWSVGKKCAIVAYIGPETTHSGPQETESPAGSSSKAPALLLWMVALIVRHS